MTQTIRDILAATVEFPNGIDAIDATSDLYEAGMTSFSSVQLMLALEEAFGIEFPERMLNRRLFATIASIQAAVSELAGSPVEA